MRIDPFIALASVAALVLGCTPPPTSTPTDAGVVAHADAGPGGTIDSGSPDDDGGEPGSVDGGVPDTDGGAPDPLQGWTWVPIEGSKCASGATAGIGINASENSDDVFIFVQGGGACWNQGTCVPSLLAYGPICYYNPNFCLVQEAGGTKPMATHVTHPDPFPADGTGVFPSEIALVSSVRAFDRSDVSNPFKDATFVFVPYCTGDFHIGDAVETYRYKYDAFGPEYDYEFHFAGANNMELYFSYLAALRPDAERVWLTGLSAGGYGATFNFERALGHFPNADVALLADSSPFVDTTPRWADWRDTWNMQLPAGCADCDQGFNNVMSYLSETHSDKRLGLLAFDADKVVRYFFYGGTGPEAALSPPAAAYTTEMTELRAIYDDSASSKYFILPTEEHVMWGGYGTKNAEGGYTAPRMGADGETDLKEWIDAWATGDPSWSSVGP